MSIRRNETKRGASQCLSQSTVGEQNSQTAAVIRRDLTIAFKTRITDIMAFKRKGELELEGLYVEAPRGITYTIVRPGGLTDGDVVGPGGTLRTSGHESKLASVCIWVRRRRAVHMLFADGADVTAVDKSPASRAQ